MATGIIIPKVKYWATASRNFHCIFVTANPTVEEKITINTSEISVVIRLFLKKVAMFPRVHASI